MAGSTNFQQWNPGAANQESDAAYTADSLRSGGAGVDNIFPSATANKLFYQLSTFVAAFCQMMSNKGYVVSDANLATLTTVLANVLTNADTKLPLISVSFGTTPVFNAGNANGFDMVLTGNVTSSTITGMQIGQIIYFVLTQDSVGGRTFAAPTGVNGWRAINPAANSVTIQAFIMKEDNSIWPYPNQYSASSLVTDGWRQYSDGGLEQWGQVVTDINGGTLAVTFPKAFPNACFNVIVTTLSNNDRITYVLQGSVSTTGFTIGNNGSDGYAYWRAVGN
jgi:hypothetical protein